MLFKGKKVKKRLMLFKGKKVKKRFALKVKNFELRDFSINRLKFF